MHQAPEFAVRVKTWPAHLLAGLLPVQTVLYTALVGLLVWQGPFSSPVYVVLFAVIVVSALAVLGAMALTARRSFRMIRYPPRLSGHGIRLWLLPSSEYVLLPWPRVVAIRAASKGLSRVLLVYVDEPEGLADGDASRARKISRMMRRFHDTPVVYPLDSSPGRLREVDEAIRWFTGGRLMLQR